MSGADDRRPRSTLRVHALIDSLRCGGAEVVLAELAGVAPTAGVELSVGYLYDVAGRPVANRLRAAGVEPRPVGARRMLRPSSLIRVRRQLRALRPDVVHTHLIDADVLGGLAARSLGIPCVSTVHAASWDGTVRGRARTTLAFAIRRSAADRVIAVSRSARDAYLVHSRIPPSRVVVVPNGIRGATVAPGAGKRIRDELGLGSDDLVVVLGGPLRREKGSLRAIAALAALRRRVPGLRALVLGDGPDAAAVLDRAGALNGSVAALGYRDDVMAVLDAADAVLHTPRTDALPTGLIEAAAAGVPVVATATGGIPEIVESGTTGLLVPPAAGPAEIAEALARLLRDRSLRASMGAEARRSFEQRFAAERWAARLREIYDSVLARG